MRVDLDRLGRVPTRRGEDGSRLGVRACHNTDAVYPAKDAVGALDAHGELGIVRGGVKRDACVKAEESYRYTEDPILNKFSEG
jgi:hypothetical protein